VEDVSVSVLIKVPLDEGNGFILVEADRADIAADEGLTLAAPEPGKAVATVSQSLGESLERIEPVVRAVKDKLQAAGSENVTVEFGIKLGGETGVILAKGTAEVNMKVTMSWGRGS
jgi:Trypsin-co-occurring domain 1